ncbi:MAG: dihydrodipicolinate synthase family protein [Segetibacter sp.]
MSPLKSKDTFGNWATLLLPVNTDESIDYSRLEEEIDIIISMKVNGIYSNGTAGEFYNQTEDEFDKISQLLTDKCHTANMPSQIGCNHTSPLITLQRVKRIKTLNPGAIQVILPDWFPPSMDEIISYLQVIAEAANPIGIVLYNPPHAKRKLTPEDFHAIKNAGIPLVGCKVAAGDANWYAAMKKLVPELSLFVSGNRLATGISLGASGSYSNMACLHPKGAQQWYDQMLTDMPAALEVESRIKDFMTNHIIPYITKKKYADPAIDKFLAAIGGWANVGTRMRWPYKWIADDEVKKVREIGKKLLPEFFVP